MLISLIIGLIIIGVVLYLVTLIPMDNTIKVIIKVLVILVVVVWLLQGLSGLSVGSFPHVTW